MKPASDYIIYPEAIRALLQLHGYAELCKLELIRFKDESDFIIEKSSSNGG